MIAERKYGKQAGVVEPLRGDAIEQLVLYLLKSPKVAYQAAKHLRPDCFRKEPHYRVLWEVVSARMQISGSLPAFDELYLTLTEALDQPASYDVKRHHRALLLATPADLGDPIDPDDTSLGVVQKPGIVYYAYKEANEADLKPAFGLELLKRFLEERALVEAIRNAVGPADSPAASDFRAMVRTYNEQGAKIATIGKSPVISMSNMTNRVRKFTVVPTGVPYLDMLMAGGAVGGEVYLIFGPWKSGKSMLATQLVQSCAQQFYNQHQQFGGLPKSAFYITFELTETEAYQRLLASGAKINLDRLQYEIASDADYSRTGSLLPYEVDHYTRRGIRSPAMMLGEFERAEAFLNTAGKHVQIVNFRGTPTVGDDADDVNTLVGTGGVDEIVQLLSDEAAEGRPPGMIVIDYLNLAVSAKLAQEGGDFERKMRSAIQLYVRDCFKKIGARFNIPVWILQQYDLSGNTASPTKTPSSTQGAESKTIGADASMVFCLGQRDRQSNVAIFSCDLSRRTKTMGTKLLLQLHGDFAEWRDVTDSYETVTSGPEANSIVLKSTQAQGHAIDTGSVAATLRTAAQAAPAVDPYVAERQFDQNNTSAF